ncbi:uncharacterized protein LOC121513230 [Cheilinus undulatus]|uniref:uncharacterized protein LOC121513230 n=1 Tax=Cheilinus undulatus TaxID=241271 RepID=UPI001BD4C39F|nr:uncharacterized protein LOC121513230 [Cheilinus undulatus]
MAAGMCVPLLVYLSIVLLQRVSAGGAYCARTARARAAALGLDYPGVNGAPDLSRPPNNEMHPRSISQTYYYNEQAEIGPNLASYGQNHPGLRPLDDSIHKKAHPMSFTSLPRSYNPGHTTHQGLSFPRGRSAINHRSNFEQVNHVAPEASSQHNLVHLNPQGHSKPPSFVNNGHDLVVDESVPNSRGVYVSGPPLPHGRGRAPYQRVDSPGRAVPVLGSARFANKEHIRGPAVDKLSRKRSPARFAHRSINVRRLNQEKPFRRNLFKPM